MNQVLEEKLAMQQKLQPSVKVGMERERRGVGDCVNQRNKRNLGSEKT